MSLISELRWYSGFKIAARCAVAGWLLSPATASADAVEVINELRSGDCGNESAAGSPVQRDDRLDLVARELSRAYSLEQALERAAYTAESAASLHLRGPGNDASMRAVLADGYCQSVNNPFYDEMGVFRNGDDTWIVLAARQPARPVLEPETVAERVLELVNAARAEARSCGPDRFEATDPLQLSPILVTAAEAHSWDMAARGRAGHDGSDGSDSGERIRRAGYVWLAAGENVAAGQPDADAVVGAWLESPGHCATLMAPYFTETGIAFAEAPSKNPPIYWTQVFAAPREQPLQDPARAGTAAGPSELSD